MPWSQPRKCTHPRCPNTTPNGGLCDHHRAQRNAELDRRRPTPTQRGYNTDWDRARTQHLQDHPLCNRCGTDTDLHVHHRQRLPLARILWNGNPHHPDNLETLCGTCHRTHHITEGHTF